MNKVPSQTTIEYDNTSGANPSLMTAGLPSGSINKPQHHQQHLNQNRATDTEPMVISTSLENQTSQYTILSHRTISDTYLNLSRKDINNVMTALHTLAEHVQTTDKENHPLPMLYSKSTNHTLKSSTQGNNSSRHDYHHYPRHSLRNRGYSSLSDRYHHVKHHLDLVEEFHHDLYDMKRKQERRILRQLQHHQHPSGYPSYSSNALLRASTCEPNTRPEQIYHCSQARQSAVRMPTEDQYQQSIKKQLSSSIALSTYILDKLVYIDQQQPISTVQMLPQQAQTLEILQNNHVHSLMSVDSLNASLLPGHFAKRNSDQAIGVGDQQSSKKIDVATQWSLQVLPLEYMEVNAWKSGLSSKCEEEVSGQQETQTNSTILTELSQSITTNTIKHSAVNISSASKTQSFVNNSFSLTGNDEHELTPSETDRFLKTLNISTCTCVNPKQRRSEIDGKTSISNNKELGISRDPVVCSALPEQKKTKETSIKFSAKQLRHARSKNSRGIKRPRLRSNNRVIQSSEMTDTTENSSFDFFDIDTTFCDTYDRLFTDTTNSEKSSA